MYVLFRLQQIHILSILFRFPRGHVLPIQFPINPCSAVSISYVSISYLPQGHACSRSSIYTSHKSTFFPLLFSVVHFTFPTSTSHLSHKCISPFPQVHLKLPTSTSHPSHEYISPFPQLHLTLPTSTSHPSHKYISPFPRVNVLPSYFMLSISHVFNTSHKPMFCFYISTNQCPV